ncbi:MAG: tRNA uridine-5-carboxymethylaminomethyl(34) synthesis GTPase MnmE [Pseudomonadota bacterium]
MESTDTICALATPTGNAGVAVIRISGPLALPIGEQITDKRLKPRYAHFVSFYDHHKATLDEGIAIYFPKPNSFTGEDVVELHPHANPYIYQHLLTTLNKLGARLAIAGEFSERAFLNGKMDLTQLEAIADLITSGSEQAARSAVLSMQGKFSKQVQEILQQLILIRTHIEASLDFSEEDIEVETRSKMGEELTILNQTLEKLFIAAQQGVQLQKGATIVLTGRPNVGKSSLFNALCAEDRAIVTNIPGTTRDVVRADIQIGGLPIQLLDTAGIREQAELVEQEGISRAHSAIETADLIIHVVDKPQSILTSKSNEIIVLNKIDLMDATETIRDAIQVSAKTGEGLKQLQDQITIALGITIQNQEPPFSARIRHLEALKRSKHAVQTATQHIQHSSPIELVAEELRLAQQSLAEITGDFTPDDLLDYVFREFCIGK